MGEQQVRDAVQRDDRLARPRAALHDERLLGRGAHDRVLLDLERRDRRAHAAGPTLGERGEQSALADEAVLVARPAPRAVERLVVHAGDPLPRGPHVPTPGETLRLARRRGVEGAGAVGAPVQDERVGVAVGRGDPDAPDTARDALDRVEPAEDQPAPGALELGPTAAQPGAPRALDDGLGPDRTRGRDPVGDVVGRSGELRVELRQELRAAGERGVEVLLLLGDGMRRDVADAVGRSGVRQGRGGLDRHGTSSRTTYGHGPNASPRSVVPGRAASDPREVRAGASPRTRRPTPRRR